MFTFLDVPLSREEEIFLTGVIVEMAEGQKITDGDVLHRLIEMAHDHDKLKIAKRELRKLRKRYEDKSDEDRLFLGKSQAYNKALDLIE